MTLAKLWTVQSVSHDFHQKDAQLSTLTPMCIYVLKSTGTTDQMASQEASPM